MKKSDYLIVFKDSFKKIFDTVLIFIVMSIINLFVFVLYDVFKEPFIYAEIISIVILLCSYFVSVFKGIKKYNKLNRMKQEVIIHNVTFPECENYSEMQYQEVIKILENKIRDINEKAFKKNEKLSDYVTSWVHQIKTPISVIRLTINGEDSESNTIISNELFRIEQYVEMVLQYVRLDSESNDFIFKEYNLDELIRKSIRKYASLFVSKKISVIFEQTDLKIVTDEKWFNCIFEQLLSNAIKYTPSGEIHIFAQSDNVLCVADTGIGIDSSDLPRIFEKGYTGNNGRIGEKSSGLGLYLCKKASEKLNISVTAESKIGEGSCFFIHFLQKNKL